VFQHPGEFCRSLIDRLEQKGHEVITVTCGKEYHPLQEDAYPGSYILNPENEGDYHRLLEELKKQGKLPHRIVHSWSITGTIGTPGPGTGGTGIHPGDIPGALAQGFYSIIYLARALGKQNIIEEIQMEVVSDHLHRVTGQEVILPQKAPLLGPLKVIPQEYAFIRCRNVDIQLPEPGNSLEEALIDRLVEEFTTKTPDTVVAYRDNYRWVQTYRPIRFGPEEAIPQIKEKGIYLITGGLGRVGLTLARYLVESAKVRVVLTGRSPFPSRDQWEQYLSGGESPGTTVLKIRKLLKLEEMGGKILTFSVDVTDPQGMQEVINLAEEQLGGLNGIIHAAGETDISVMRSIEQLQPPDCQKQFAAKIYGLLNLYTLVKNRKLDFCWLTSSLSPILGGLGLSAYAAGNHFMDAFAHYCQQHSRNRWISVNWADWTFAPGTPDGDKEDTQSSQKDIGQVEWGMKPREGVETFRRILFHCLESQVVVSTVNLQARIDQWVKLESLRQEQPSKQTVPSYAYKSRPQLENPFVKPSNYLEQNIADVLQDFLGIEEVGIDDNFYELGATSLNIIQINSKVREKLKMDISVMRWFEYPTIKALTGYLLETKVGLAPSEEEIDRSQTIDKGINKLKKIKQRTRN
jgi:NAD(P)-dependent dehydrogenase (short-subunit alcohol dehydrogenase family)/acyl carrier protein